MYEKREIVIDMNPVQLRNLADKLKRAYEDRKLGQPTFVECIGHNKDHTLQVNVHFDQHWMDKHHV
jgi:hypothetical protein